MAVLWYGALMAALGDVEVEMGDGEDNADDVHVFEAKVDEEDARERVCLAVDRWV